MTYFNKGITSHVTTQIRTNQGKSVYELNKLIKHRFQSLWLSIFIYFSPEWGTLGQWIS